MNRPYCRCLALALCASVLAGCYGQQQAVRDLNASTPAEREKAADYFRKVPSYYDTPESRDALLKALDSPDKHVVYSAIYALGQLKERRAVDPLLLILKDKPDYSDAAAESLGQIGDNRALLPLIEWARSGLRKQPEVSPKYWLNPVLGVCERDDRAVPFLLELTLSSDQFTRNFAAQGLGKTRSPKAIPRLREMMLSDKDDSGHSVAIKALGLIGHEDEEAARALELRLIQLSDAYWEQVKRQPEQDLPHVQPHVWQPDRQFEIETITNSLVVTHRASALVAIVADLQRIDRENRLPISQYGYPYETMLRSAYSLGGDRPPYSSDPGSFLPLPPGVSRPENLQRKWLKELLVWWDMKRERITALAARGERIN